MAWIKDLGRVTGNDGNVYMPTVDIKNGQFVFKWELKTAEEALDALQSEKSLTIPVYVPEQSSQDKEAGQMTFKLTIPIKDAEGNYLSQTKTVYVKGEKGDTGTSEFSIYDLENEGISIMNTDDIPSNIPVTDRNTWSIYIYKKDAWLWTGSDFFMMEGIKLDGYCKTSDVYTRTEIDEMFSDIESETEKILLLYDIDNSVSNI